MHERATPDVNPVKIFQRVLAAAVMIGVFEGVGAILVFVADRSPRDAPRAAGGSLDVGRWDFARGPIALSGEWSFFPGALVAPSGMAARPERSYAVRVPGAWRGAAMSGAYGCGTYCLSLERSSVQEGLAILVPDEAIAWRLYVNGALEASSGVPAPSAALTVVRRQSVLVPLADPSAGDGPMELSIQVSNFSYDVGGLINPILIGTASLLAARVEAMSALSGFFLGGLFLMALFTFYLFILRIDDRSSLYLSLFCFFMLLRSLMISHYPERVFAGTAIGMFAFDLSMRVEYLAFYLGIPVYLAFVAKLFPAEFERRVLRASLAVALAFSAVVAVAPAPFFMAWTTRPYQALTVVECCYALFVFAKAAARRRTGALYGLIGFAAFFLIVVNDILHANLVIRTAHLSPLGLMIFTISQSFIISSRIASTFDHEKQLARELAEEKRLLDRRIAERTAELSASNRRLLDVDRAKSRFLATVSHELRTPITLIVSPLEQAARGGYGPSIPADGELLARVLRSGYRMLNIIEGMFDFARLELGRLSPRLESVDLAALLAFYSAELEALARKKGIALSFENALSGRASHATAEAGRASLDPRLFEIAFFNVVSNALKFTKRGGSVAIRLEGPLPDGSSSIAVRDNGIGIRPELLPRIFSKLDWQADDAARLHDGAGIGLSLTKKIVELHGGRITAESSGSDGGDARSGAEGDARGGGSTFTIVLPAPRKADETRTPSATPNASLPIEIGERARAIASEALVEPRPETASPKGNTGPSILLVEDNAELLGFMRERLESRFAVRSAADGEEALRVLGEAPVELVVTDVMMPKMDGLTLFREAKRLLADECPPFIFLTARGDRASLGDRAMPDGGERLEAFAEGVVDYLGKPFDVDELALKIESILAMRERDREGARRGVKEALAKFIEGGGKTINGPAPSAAGERRSELLGLLSQREAQVAERAAKGMQDKEIAKELELAPRTVSNTLLRVYRKLGVENRYELISYLNVLS